MGGKRAKDLVPRLRPAEASPAGAPVPVVRPDPRGARAPDPGAQVARSPAGRLATVRRREPAAVAWRKLAAPLRERPLQGIRVGALGVSGKGKTTGMASFLAYLEAERLIDVFVIHDVKLPEPQYAGTVAHEADMILAPPEGQAYPMRVVLRRSGINHVPDLERAARVVVQASFAGVPSMLLVDEFKRALSPAGREFTAPTVREILSEGRALGASLLWTTQIPQRVPTEGYDMSQITLYGQGPKSVTYLQGQSVIDERAAEVVSGLATGEFIIASSEEEWDGVIYVVPPPGARA